MLKDLSYPTLVVLSLECLNTLGLVILNVLHEEVSDHKEHCYRGCRELGSDASHRQRLCHMELSHLSTKFVDSNVSHLD